MRMMMTAALAALIVTGAAVAEPVKGRANVDDTSLTMSGGERVLRESIVIRAPRAALWARFSTVEGLKSWEAPVVSIDLRTGGLMQASYDPKATLGDPSTIAHEIVTYVPESLMVFRNVKTPKGFPWPEQFARVTTVIQLEDAGDGATRVTVSGVGYRPEDKALYDFFQSGNAYLLETLKAAVEGGPGPSGPAH